MLFHWKFKFWNENSALNPNWNSWCPKKGRRRGLGSNANGRRQFNADGRRFHRLAPAKQINTQRAKCARECVQTVHKSRRSAVCGNNRARTARSQSVELKGERKPELSCVGGTAGQAALFCVLIRAAWIIACAAAWKHSGRNGAKAQRVSRQFDFLASAHAAFPLRPIFNYSLCVAGLACTRRQDKVLGRRSMLNVYILFGTRGTFDISLGTQGKRIHHRNKSVNETQFGRATLWCEILTARQRFIRPLCSKSDNSDMILFFIKRLSEWNEMYERQLQYFWENRTF